MIPNRKNKAHWPTKENKQNVQEFLNFWAHAKICLKWPQMRPGGFFPTDPDLADILGDTHFDFENLIPTLWISRFQNSSISKIPTGREAASIAKIWRHTDIDMPMGRNLFFICTPTAHMFQKCRPIHISSTCAQNLSRLRRSTCVDGWTRTQWMVMDATRSQGLKGWMRTQRMDEDSTHGQGCNKWSSAQHIVVLRTLFYDTETGPYGSI